ncbi:unnamed protein product [Closterium sp. NIES-54]
MGHTRTGVKRWACAHRSSSSCASPSSPHSCCLPFVQAGQWGWRAGEEGLFEGLGKEASRLRAILESFNRAAPSQVGSTGMVEEDGVDGVEEEVVVGPVVVLEDAAMVLGDWE